MLHANDPTVRTLLLQGEFGLERESLRVDGDGFFSQTPHPLPEEPNIVRDFCENQTEINTPVCASIAQALDSLGSYDRMLRQRLARQPRPEYLWPFSSPPYIRGEEDIPIAQFFGCQAEKTTYREYLSRRYGRYKMTFSGIHVNFSFGQELLRADFALTGGDNFQGYKDRLYLDLAAKIAKTGWVLTALTAASPLLDSSFAERGELGGDVFTGLGSVRCSEMGYWNSFTPIFDYTSPQTYGASIQRYVDEGLLRAASELYYPVRLKPRGENTLEALKNGVSHIELRMFDLNPLAPFGADERDLAFAQLLLVWLASTPEEPFPPAEQVQAAQNFKNAAHYDLRTVNLTAPNGGLYSIEQAGRRVLARMREFYVGFPLWVQQVLNFQEEKLLRPETRYAWQVRRRFSGGFVQKGLAWAKGRQRE